MRRSPLSDTRFRPRLPMPRRARPATTGLTVQVSIVAGSVQIAKDGQVIGVHPIRHDRSRELGALANPEGRPAAPPPAKTIMSRTYRSADVARVRTEPRLRVGNYLGRCLSVSERSLAA